jgi:hypothetical protein
VIELEQRLELAEEVLAAFDRLTDVGRAPDRRPWCAAIDRLDQPGEGVREQRHGMCRRRPRVELGRQTQRCLASHAVSTL